MSEDGLLSAEKGLVYQLVILCKCRDKDKAKIWGETSHKREQ